jgi:hypothetical protein
MLTLIENTLRSKAILVQTTLAIVLGIIGANVYSSPLNAQTNTLKDNMFENIEAGEEGWNFLSEEETISIQNNLNQLEDYSILDSSFDSDIQLMKESWRWRNQGNRPNYPDYSLETEVYDY